MVEKLLKLSCGLTSVSGLQVSQTAKVSGDQESVTKVVRNGGGENVDGLVWLVPSQRNCGPDRRQVAILDLGIQGMFVRKFVGNFLCLRKVARQCKCQRRSACSRPGQCLEPQPRQQRGGPALNRQSQLPPTPPMSSTVLPFPASLPFLPGQPLLPESSRACFNLP